jgi:CHAT domain-containing protein
MEERLRRAFQLAFFILREEQVALRATANAVSALDVTLVRQDKRIHYLPGHRTKVSLGEWQMLQRLIYIAAEAEERRQEQQGVTEAALVMHYIKHLVYITVCRNSFFVALGLCRLLHNYTTSETTQIHELVTQDPDRGRDDSYYRRRKAQLMRELQARFGALLTVQRGARGEERFQALPDAQVHLAWVRECLREFTPWGTDCNLPDAFDPYTDELPLLRFRGDDPDGEHEVEIRRLHVLLHPECFDRLLVALRLDAAGERLEVPQFQLRDNQPPAAPDGGQPPTPQLSEEDMQSLEETIVQERERRRRFSPAWLRFVVDGVERARWLLAESRSGQIEIAPDDKLIEIYGSRDGEDLRLAAHLLSYDADDQPQPIAATLTLEGGQQLRLVVEPLSATDEENAGATIAVSYRETAPLRALRWWWRRRRQRIFNPLLRPIADWLLAHRPIAATVIAVAVLTGPVWYLWQRNQPVERAMTSLRNVWTVSRPIEPRITGDFPHLPFDRARGASSQATVNKELINRDQLMAAEAELKREVADKGSAKSRHALAKLYLLQSEFDDAEEQLTQVLKEEPRDATAHVDLAAVYYEKGVRGRHVIALLEAAKECKKAIEIAPKLPEAWFNLALTHEQMMLMTDALKDWERYREIDSTSRWAEEARTRLQNLRQRAVPQEPQPEKVAEELLAASAGNNDAVIRRLLEENFTEVSDLIGGRFLDEYLKSAIEGNQREAEKRSQLLRHLAQMVREVKKDYYFSDLLRFVASSDPARLGKIREVREQLRQGETLHQEGLYVQALEVFTAAKSGAERIADDCHVEAAMYGLARIHTPQTETTEMSTVRRRLLSEADRRHHLQMKASALLALANQYNAELKLSSFLEASLQAHKIASQISDTDLIVVSLRRIGVAYSNLGEEEQGLQAHYSATQTLYSRPVNSLRACQTYVQFATSLADYSHYHEAQDYQRQALPFCQRSKNPSVYLPAIGRAGKYTALAGQPEEAVRLLREALPEAERYRQTKSAQILLVDLYLSLGDALVRDKRFGEAESVYEKAREMIGQKNHLKYLSAINRGLADALLPQGKIAEAEVALNKSIELTELSRGNVSAATGRSAFVSGMLNVYQSMVAFQYFQKKSPARAFDFSEIYRNGELLDLIAHSRELRWEENKNDLTLPTSTEALTLSQIQKDLPTSAQIVEYAITENHLLIWVTDRERWAAKSVSLPSIQLQAMVSDYLQALREHRSPDSLNVLAKKLYQILIQPVKAELNPHGNLVIIPDGILGSLPFAALVDPLSTRYLLEDYTLTVDPSANILVRMLERSQSRKRKTAESLLAVSDPEFDRMLFPTLPRLPKAGEEVRELHSLYPVYLQLENSRATKEEFLRMAGDFSVLHLATHSVVNTQEPLLSAIVLAAKNQATQTDSILQAHEIFRLKLPQTRLVILSSCNSLVNQQSGHNGLGGLAHAFFSAGAPTVIGSLWEVNDESAASLMSEFHRLWRGSKLNTGEALRQAQLGFLRSANERWRHPFYWAAFLVSGDGITN